MLLTLHEVQSEHWTRTEQLLASIYDRLGEVAYSALMGPHGDPKKLKRLKPPKPLPRPGVTRKRRKATSEDLRAFFGRVRGQS